MGERADTRTLLGDTVGPLDGGSGVAVGDPAGVTTDGGISLGGTGHRGDALPGRHRIPLGPFAEGRVQAHVLPPSLRKGFQPVDRRRRIPLSPLVPHFLDGPVGKALAGKLFNPLRRSFRIPVRKAVRHGVESRPLQVPVGQVLGPLGGLLDPDTADNLPRHDSKEVIGPVIPFVGQLKDIVGGPGRIVVSHPADQGLLQVVVVTLVLLRQVVEMSDGGLRVGRGPPRHRVG